MFTFNIFLRNSLIGCIEFACRLSHPNMGKFETVTFLLLLAPPEAFVLKAWDVSTLDFVQILVRTMLRKRSFGNPFDLARKEERGIPCASGQPGP